MDVTNINQQKYLEQEYGELVEARGKKPSPAHRDIQPSMITGSFIDTYLATGNLERGEKLIEIGG